MRKNFILGLAVLAVVIVLLVAVLLSNGSWIFPREDPVRNLDTGIGYKSIQSALDDQKTVDGNRISIANGVYYEHVTVSKAVSLIGEDKENTIIDGEGTGDVVQVNGSSLEISNLTIRHAPNSAWAGKGFPASCISLSEVTNVTVQNSILTNATVCAWIYASFNVTFRTCSISNGGTMGIIFYSSSGCEASQNIVNNCELVGMHIDGESVNCELANNEVSGCGEGIDLEKSSQNIVNWNDLSNNNVSLDLYECGASNILRANNMSGYKNNLIVWGSSLGAFLQDIDASNIVDGKAVHYLVGLTNTEINTQSAQNAGYLSLVNCTNVTVKGIQLLSNKDGFLFAESNNCTLDSLTIDGNTNATFGTGLTFFHSNNNTITSSEVSNNSRGVCFYQSNGNIFFRNSFVGNIKQVASDFSSPFSTTSSSLSANIWDNGAEGNYWGDYKTRYPNAAQVGATGIENTPYIIDSNNVDAHPLATNLP